MNSLIWRILWVHGWIPKNEFTLIWNHGWIHWSWLDLDSASKFKSVSVKEQILLNQSNNYPFFAASSLPAAAAGEGRHCCDGRRQVLLHRIGGTCRAWWTTLDVTGVEICMGQALLGHFLSGSTITIITHMCQSHTCGWVLAPGPWPNSKCSKQWKSGVHVKSIILSAQDRHWQNPRKKNWWRAQQYEKRTCQCTDWLSATPIGWGKAESFSRLRDSNQSPRPTANTLTTEPWFVSFCREKWFFTCSV